MSKSPHIDQATYCMSCARWTDPATLQDGDCPGCVAARGGRTPDNHIHPSHDEDEPMSDQALVPTEVCIRFQCNKARLFWNEDAGTWDCPNCRGSYGADAKAENPPKYALGVLEWQWRLQPECNECGDQGVIQDEVDGPLLPCVCTEQHITPEYLRERGFVEPTG